MIEGTVHSLGDLPGKRIGVLTNSQADLYATDLELPDGENEPSVIVRYDSLDQAVEDLKTGVLDCVIMDASHAGDYCSTNEQLATLEEAFSWQEYSICLGADRTEFADTINQLLALMEENGTLKEITDQYISIENTDSVVSDQISDENSSEISEDILEDISNDDSEGETGEILNTGDSEQLLRVATSSGFQPYTYYDENGNLTGIDIDIANALAKQLGMAIQITDMDYESLFISVADGTADFAIAGISPSEDLVETCIFTDAYTTACQMVLIRK